MGYRIKALTLDFWNTIADAMAGRTEIFDLFANYPHFRLPGGQWFGNQIIALGMLYFRMKDLF